MNKLDIKVGQVVYLHLSAWCGSECDKVVNLHVESIGRKYAKAFDVELPNHTYQFELGGNFYNAHNSRGNVYLTMGAIEDERAKRKLWAEIRRFAQLHYRPPEKLSAVQLAEACEWLGLDLPRS